MENEAGLISGILQGNHRDFRLVVEEYQDMLFDLALRLVLNRQDAEDVVQDAFVKLYRHLRDYDSAQSLRNWLYTITLNTARSFLRRKAVLRFMSLDWDFGRGEGEPPGDYPDLSGDMLDQLSQKSSGEALERAVSSMSLRLREVFALHYLHGMDLRTAAGVIGISENAAKLRLMRARRFLRMRMAGAKDDTR